MKIAIFENEYNQVKAAFDTVNLLYFDNSLQINVFQSSQEIQDFKSLQEYDVVIVDIDLSHKSALDGYGILKAIETLINKSKILIITGSSRVEQVLKEKSLPNYAILLKPLDFLTLHSALLSIKNGSS